MKQQEILTDNDKKKTGITAVFFIAGLSVVLALVALFVFRLNRDASFDRISEPDMKVYDRYYAFISDSPESSYWQEVFDGAHEEGELTGAYVEEFAVNPAAYNTPAERVEIAVASGVDGIIAQGRSGTAFKKALLMAADEGIPVVMAEEDDTTSGRISFVGVSKYDLGTVYGRQAAALSKKLLSRQDRVKVTVLTSQGSDAGTRNLLMSTVREVLLADADLTGRITLDTYAVSDTGTFAAEESIKDLFMNRENIPDILIALNEEHTNSAYQAVIDYNIAGTCNIIGYYESDSIKNAIENEVIYSTVTADVKQMGTYCTKALDEYIESGYVNEFFAVDTHVIDKESVFGQTDTEEEE